MLEEPVREGAARGAGQAVVPEVVAVVPVRLDQPGAVLGEHDVLPEEAEPTGRDPPGHRSNHTRLPCTLSTTKIHDMLSTLQYSIGHTQNMI